MSGIEIAGLVLGGFPLLVSAAEHYKEGFQPLVKWKRFRTDFIGFIDAVDIERQLFINTIERFLMTADLPQEEIQAFMTVHGYEGWQREDLAESLRRRLGPTYPAYLSTIKTMSELMDDLKDLLRLKNGKVDWAKDGESRWDYQMKRIHLSFSKRGERTLSSLETHNRKLRELLDSNDKLDGMRAARKDTKWASIFHCIRNHASSLHTAIKNSWNCNCTGPHTTSLRLQKRVTGGWSSQFHVDFSDPRGESLARREIVISVREKKDVIHMATKKATSPNLGQPFLSLRHDFESRSPPRINDNSGPILGSSGSSENMTRSISSSISSHTSFRDLFTRAESSSSTTTISSSNGTQSVLSRRTLKPSKSVRFNPPIELAVKPDVPDVSVCEPGTEVKIDDLCSILISNNVRHCLGYILDNEQREYELRPLKEDQLVAPKDACELVSLETMLRSQNESRLNRQERFKIASILASSLLQLQSTPWLADKMDKKSIFFFKYGDKILVEQPYICHSFTSTKVIQSFSETPLLPSAKRFAVRSTLSHLGILLLELCFGQAIEDQQDLRKDHLGQDGKAHKETDFLTAMDWSEMVSGEEPELEPIIKCCVFCAFQEKADWDNKLFVQAVYASVVEPLEKFISKWPIQ